MKDQLEQTNKLLLIKRLLQDLLIIECKKTGISKSEARKIVGVADKQLTRIWKHIKID